MSNQTYVHITVDVPLKYGELYKVVRAVGNNVTLQKINILVCPGCNSGNVDKGSKNAWAHCRNCGEIFDV